MEERMPTPLRPTRRSTRLVKRVAKLTAILALGLALTMVVLMYTRTITIWRWKRENPLQNPIAVRSVSNGLITLSNGRTLAPAGVRKRDVVSPQDYDHALRAATAQGVVIVHDLGDGRAFLKAEPMFYNWCGTGNYKWGIGWAGSYLQVTLSEFLVYAGYADPEPSPINLDQRQGWRLEGAREMSKAAIGETEPFLMTVTESQQFRYDSYVEYFRDYADLDGQLEALWQPPPKP